MTAYEEIRDDVIAQHQALTQTAGSSYQERDALSVPNVSVSGKQPAWLVTGWRQILVVAALLGAVAGLALLASLSDDSAAGASFGRVFAVISLIVAYFTVAGFGEAPFSIGSGHAERTKAGPLRAGSLARLSSGS